MYIASLKRDIGKQSRPSSAAASDQELHSLLTGNYIRNRIKMKQDTWQLLNGKWSRPSDKDGIFLGQYRLIVSLSVLDATVSVGPSLCSVPTEWSVGVSGMNCWFS